MSCVLAALLQQQGPLQVYLSLASYVVYTPMPAVEVVRLSGVFAETEYIRTLTTWTTPTWAAAQSRMSLYSAGGAQGQYCLLYTSPSPRDQN